MEHSIVLGKTFREHIGGRWAISWQIYVVNVPINFLAILTSIRVGPQGSDWLGWVVVALAGLAAIAVTFALAGLTVLRNRRRDPVPIPVVVAVGAVTGIFRGTVVVTAASLLNLQSFTVDEWINRSLAGGLVGAIALPLGALTLSIVATYRSERRSMINDRVTIERERLQQQGDIETLRTTLVQGVQQEVTAALESVSGADAHTVSEAMRATSHRIWDQERQVSVGDEVRIRDVLWSSIRTRPLPVLPALAVWGLSALGTLIAAIGPVRGLANLVYALAALWLCLVLANRWIRARPDQWGLATTVMLVIAYVLTSPVSYFLFDPRPLDTAIPIMVMNAVWLPVVVLLIAISTSAVASSELVLDQISKDVTVAEVKKRAVEAERDHILREIAVRLHGTAHSPMVAGSALLASSEDAAARERLLEYVGRAVAQLDTRDRPADFAESLTAVGSPWDGLVDVHVAVTPEVVTGNMTEQTRRLVERIVEEALANAYRHGGASRVDVHVDGRDGRLIVRVTDNGCGPQGSLQPGLGCRLFETAATDSWSLRGGSHGGAELEIVLG